MELFGRVPVAIDPFALRQKVALSRLPELCAAIPSASVRRGNVADVGTIWGDFELHREFIRGGLRFSLVDCPNALAWTLTTGLPPEPEVLVVHVTTNRRSHDADMEASLHEFLEAWVEGLSAHLG